MLQTVYDPWPGCTLAKDQSNLEGGLQKTQENVSASQEPTQGLDGQDTTASAGYCPEVQPYPAATCTGGQSYHTK